MRPIEKQDESLILRILEAAESPVQICYVRDELATLGVKASYVTVQNYLTALVDMKRVLHQVNGRFSYYSIVKYEKKEKPQFVKAKDLKGAVK